MEIQQTVEWLLSLTMKNLKRGRHLEYHKIHESWAVRVYYEWAEERNNLFLIIGDSKTVPQVNLILRDFEYHW